MQVSPSEIEDLLLGHQAVSDAGVAGIPDVEAGEVPHAWVVLKRGFNITEEELKHWMSGTPISNNTLVFVVVIKFVCTMLYVVTFSVIQQK